MVSVLEILSLLNYMQLDHGLIFKIDLIKKGYIAMEWWKDDFEAIRFATVKGIIVVRAAGNGAEDLDEPIYKIDLIVVKGIRVSS